jgi:hypothetical protein
VSLRKLTLQMDENAFKLNLPPYLDLHLVFHMELLQSYFPPLLDASKVVEQLATTKVNPNCIEKTRVDKNTNTEMKRTHKKIIRLYPVVKVGQLLQRRK